MSYIKTVKKTCLPVLSFDSSFTCVEETLRSVPVLNAHVYRKKLPRLLSSEITAWCGDAAVLVQVFPITAPFWFRVVFEKILGKTLPSGGICKGIQPPPFSPPFACSTSKVLRRFRRFSPRRYHKSRVSADFIGRSHHKLHESDRCGPLTSQILVHFTNRVLAKSNSGKHRGQHKPDFRGHHTLPSRIPQARPQRPPPISRVLVDSTSQLF